MLLLRKILFASFLFPMLFMGSNERSQNTPLQDSLRVIAKEAGGMVGVSVLYPERGESLSLHGADHFPMQSVYKFPLAMKILHDVDNGKLSLDSKIHIDKKEWVEGTWSPMRDHYNSGTVDINLREILSYTVSGSDNIGCDILFRVAGGPGEVNDYIHQLGIKEIAIATTEADKATHWAVPLKNRFTPTSLAPLLNLFFVYR